MLTRVMCVCLCRHNHHFMSTVPTHSRLIISIFTLIRQNIQSSRASVCLSYTILNSHDAKNNEDNGKCDNTLSQYSLFVSRLSQYQIGRREFTARSLIYRNSDRHRQRFHRERKWNISPHTFLSWLMVTTTLHSVHRERSMENFKFETLKEMKRNSMLLICVSHK